MGSAPNIGVDGGHLGVSLSRSGLRNREGVGV